ncbi:MAG: two-component system response regulator [Acidobacteria bacterium]|nr:MAG: two-component system response regulator [Acidobacteriota bacterium]
MRPKSRYDPRPVDEPHSHDVLVVEDDSNARQTISIALERKGLRVMVAEDGVEAMRVLALRRFCVLLLDLVLPKADGYAVIAYVKANMPEVPVIVMTSLSADELSGLDRSIVKNVLFKPLPMEEMADRVQGVCHG